MSTTKAKINLKEGIIELEGSESFVTKELEIYQKQINEMNKSATITSNAETSTEEGKPEGDKTTLKKKTVKSAQAVIPIPLDLKAKDNKPSLRDFYKQKNPATQSESVVVFAYYLKEYLKTDKMEAGHVSSCAKEVGIKVPTNITQMFYDVHRNNGWFNLSEGRKFAEINTAGENFVIHDLPRKEDASKD